MRYINERRVDNLTICYRKKQIDASFSCVCPVFDNEFHHNIVKVVCRYRLVDPQPLTMLQQNS